ncbi:MAG: MerR family transcriptional regulator [Clostridiales bacterium]|nr:MerR family transcriptional regulator [Clostridiales bacterium]
MKIKQVCDLTGLTDRAVRYYIEEGLISPQYTENYLGRKSYRFSQQDVLCLQDIGTLRKFGFSIEEIRRIQHSPAAAQDVITHLIREKQDTVSMEQAALETLQCLPCDDLSLARLAERLSQPAKKACPPAENRTPPPPDTQMQGNRERPPSLPLCMLGLFLALQPIGFFLYYRVWHATFERYAVIQGWGYLALLAVLLPAAVMAWLGGRRLFGRRKISRKLIAWCMAGCLLWQPMSALCARRVFAMSETTDMEHYMALDVGCRQHSSSVLGLFPQYPGYGDRKYYYRHDDNLLLYDVYAEWTLDKDALQAEIARAEALFASGKYGFHYDSGIQRVETEHFSCLFSVEPVVQAPGGEPSAPFRQMNDRHYGYAIFAWNEETGRVRYCVGEYFLGRKPIAPYYLSLEW